MNYIDGMNHEYQTVFSLGDNCWPAIRLKDHRLRLCAGPFDWLDSTNNLCTESTLKNRFKDFMLRENLVIDGELTGKNLRGSVETTYIVKDTLSGLKSAHDFLKQPGTDKLVDYEGYKVRVDMIVSRFLWCMENLETVLFIRRSEVTLATSRDCPAS